MHFGMTKLHDSVIWKHRFFDATRRRTFFYARDTRPSRTHMMHSTMHPPWIGKIAHFYGVQFENNLESAPLAPADALPDISFPRSLCVCLPLPAVDQFTTFLANLMSYQANTKSQSSAFQIIRRHNLHIGFDHVTGPFSESRRCN